MSKNSKMALWLSVPAFVGCLAVRLLQIVGGTNMDNGALYYDNNFLLRFGYYGLVVIVFAAAIVFAFLDWSVGSRFYTNTPAVISGKKAAVLGFGLLVVGILAAYEGLCEASIPEGSGVTGSGFLIFVDFIFGAGMIALAFVILYLKEMKPAVGFSFVAAALYFTLRGVYVFLDKMVVSNIPEYTIQCVSVIGMAMFFMLSARFLSGNGTKRTPAALAAVGVTVSVLTLSNAAATIAAKLIAPPSVASKIVADAFTKKKYYQQLHGIDAYYMAFVPWVEAAGGALLLIMLFLMSSKEEEKPVPAENGDQGEASETE